MKNPHTRVLFRIIFGLLLITLLVSVYTFVLQTNYSKAAVDEAVTRNEQCADAIHTLVSNKFTKEDFETITSKKDMDTERYAELQQQLNELRSLNSTRYLYTAKRDDDGKLIYLIDGLDLDAEDFAYPGTYIEDEMIPYIEAALSGEITYSQKIVDTTWGHIFTACYPVLAADGSGEILGALCMEMDMESTYSYMESSNKKAIETAAVAVVVFFALGIIVYIYLRKQKQNEADQQQRLERAVSAADEANKAKSTFLFNMSHDIRTPMNAILGFTELAAKDTQTSEQTKDYLKKIQISGKKMLSIIDNVLELSRIESGKVILEETAVAAGSIFDACLVMVEPEIQKKNLKLTVSKEIIYPYAYVDTTRITEIILNLISNSIKYTHEGGSIHCAIRQSEDAREG